MAVKSSVLDYPSSIRFAFIFLLGTVVWLSIFLVPSIIVSIILIYTFFSFLFVLVPVLGLILFVLILLSSFIWTISQTKHFACKIQFAYSFKITFNLLRRLNLALLIVGTLFMILNEQIGGFLFVLVVIGLVHPLSSAYFMLEWVFENKDNKNLTNDPNFLYILNEGIEGQNFEEIESNVQIIHNQQLIKIESNVEKESSIEMKIFCGYCGNNNNVTAKDQKCNNCNNVLDTSKFNDYLKN